MILKIIGKRMLKFSDEEWTKYWESTDYRSDTDAKAAGFLLVPLIGAVLFIVLLAAGIIPISLAVGIGILVATQLIFLADPDRRPPNRHKLSFTLQKKAGAFLDVMFIYGYFGIALVIWKYVPAYASDIALGSAVIGGVIGYLLLNSIKYRKAKGET